MDMTQRVPEMRSSVQSYRYILEGRRSPSKMASLQAQAEAQTTTHSHSYGHPHTQSHAATDATNNQSSAKSHAHMLLSQQQNSPFPPYFSKIVHPLFQKLHVRGVTPDDRIAIIAEVHR